MTRLRGHFDGQGVVLDEAPPPDLKPNTPVEIFVLGKRQQAIRRMEAFWKELWARPLPPTTQPLGPRWKREDLYERG
jgi:hypothetical protein